MYSNSRQYWTKCSLILGYYIYIYVCVYYICIIYCKITICVHYKIGNKYLPTISDVYGICYHTILANWSWALTNWLGTFGSETVWCLTVTLYSYLVLSYIFFIYISTTSKLIKTSLNWIPKYITVYYIFRGKKPELDPRKVGARLLVGLVPLGNWFLVLNCMCVCNRLIFFRWVWCFVGRISKTWPCQTTEYSQHPCHVSSVKTITLSFILMIIIVT